MATLTPLAPVIGGTTYATTAATTGAGDQVANPKGTVMLMVTNGSGSSINVTLAAAATVRPASGGFPPMTLANNVVAVGAGVTMLIGPIPKAFNNLTDGNVHITYSAVTTVTVAAIQP